MRLTSLNRRAFLKQVAAWSAGLTFVEPIFRLDNLAFAADGVPTLAVAVGKDYEALVARVLEPLGGIGAFVKRGDRVVIKPNIGWDRSPEQAANTHPLVVKALARHALDAGARSVAVFDRPCNDARRTYHNSGIAPAVDALRDGRATWSYVDNRAFVPVNMQRGKAVDRWPIYREALQADCYINVPVAKHHGLTRLTLGLKNVMGVCGGKRGEIHRDIAQKLADLATVIEPKLTVIDATRILLRHGPSGGNLDDVQVRDTLIAAVDPVAADAHAATLFGLEPGDIEPTRKAYEMGLGEMDLNKINVVKA